VKCSGQGEFQRIEDISDFDHKTYRWAWRTCSRRLLGAAGPEAAVVLPYRQMLA